MTHSFHPKRSLLVMVTCLTSALFSGCAALDQMEAENYQKKCESLGISRDSPSFETCILQQQALEDEDIQRSLDRSAMQKRHK